ncbi:MAG: hypothetical protein K8R02_01110 [Anaerohalosphaeraceae bacterium]|nr:hypothetical protein [Anaerohalosphaeraceae bacterium]
MKSERRHELATNELADWLVHFPQWLRQNRTTVTVGSIVTVALIAYTVFYYGFYDKKNQSAQPRITQLLEQVRHNKLTVLHGKGQELGVSNLFFNTASGLEQVSRETEHPLLSSLAMIKRAEALRSELHYRGDAVEADVRQSQLTQAQGIYQQAFKKASGEPVISAMAQYGTGLCLEDMGQLDQAIEVYSGIAGNPDYQGTMYIARAKVRLSVLAESRRPVYMTKAPAVPDANQPLWEISDSNSAK